MMIYDSQSPANVLREHYTAHWGGASSFVTPQIPLLEELPDGFEVLEFTPHLRRNMWIYATTQMSEASHETGLELHLFSPRQQPSLAEILSFMAYYHNATAQLEVGYTVDFGMPWLEGSACRYGLISLPYMDGPQLENLYLPKGRDLKCLWLVPITESERDFKSKHGLEALETKFEEAEFNYLDPVRESVV